MVDSTYTGIAFLVPNGDVPPIRNPECRLATSGLQGSTRFAPICRARFLVETVLSPCMSTINGFACSSSITSVLTTQCSSTPNWRAERDLVPTQKLRRRGLGNVFYLGHDGIVAARKHGHHRPNGQLCKVNSCGTIVRNCSSGMRHLGDST